MKNKQKKQQCASIGGQAVIEGVMMRGKGAMATAVRDPEGKVQIESERLAQPKKKKGFSRWPFVRGVVNFVRSLIDGNRILMRSADVAAGDDDQPSKAEKWLNEKCKIHLGDILNWVSIVLGIGLAIVIFILLPQWITGFLPTHIFDKTSHGWTGVWFNLVEGGIRLTIFILYVVLIALIPSLKRVFMYHGAEHKTIACYEKGEQLTVANVKKCSRVHDRCGTTFLFLVMVVSIIVFSLANIVVARWLYTSNDTANGIIRFAFKLLMLPVVAGISYEILRLLSKTKSKFFLIFKAPGLLLQRLTTKEPADDMIECAIAAFHTVLEMEADPTIPEKVFATSGKMSALLKNTKRRFAAADIEEDEAEWIFALVLDMPKSAVATEEYILKVSQAKKIIGIADERLTGRPLWYIIGDTDFYGYKIKVDERVLIPRPETEELASLVLGAAEEGHHILDLCTGSGAIAVAVYKEMEKRGTPVKVTAVDISEDALAVAQENAEANGAEITFVQSDLFKRVRGRFDIIVSNPPYIPTADIETLQKEVRDFEPRLALDGGVDGLDIYRKIAKDATKYLNRNGMLIMEVGAGEAEEIIRMFKGVDYAVIIKDFNGVDRYVKVVI
ncbi:MAG: peptide chain release factor N(5)-glutamine methyltransferase [Clostridiales bacterium]|nr:peptide chain release factor N(5)-glutamine methyltransferase [Clostridiales bacterium]